jgi:hypothetical protein
VTLDAVNAAIEQLASAVDGDRVQLNVEGVLSEIRDNAADVRATRHPLGFIHVDVTEWSAEQRDDVRCRLHLWPSEGFQSDQLGSCHDHAWTLKSVVLVGTLTDVTYKPQRNRDGTFSGVRVTYGVENQFTPEGRFELSEARRRPLTAGDVYELAARTVHATELLAGPAATLLLTVDDDDGKGPLVFTRFHKGAVGTAVRVRVPPDELTRAIDQALAAA